MSSYDIYKSFGRVVGLKEMSARFFLFSAKWYEKPFLRFIIWREEVKRWLTAETRLEDDNPFGCIFKVFIAVLVIGLILFGGLLTFLILK